MPRRQELLKTNGKTSVDFFKKPTLAQLATFIGCLVFLVAGVRWACDAKAALDREYPPRAEFKTACDDNAKEHTLIRQEQSSAMTVVKEQLADLKEGQKELNRNFNQVMIALGEKKQLHLRQRATPERDDR